MNEIRELLLSGADANTKDSSGFTLLMTYAKKDDIESMRLLIEYAAKVNVKDDLGFTALDYAIQAGNSNAVRLLIQSGANVSNETYMIAVNKGNREIIDFLDSLDPDKYIFLKNKKKVKLHS